MWRVRIFVNIFRQSLRQFNHSGSQPINIMALYCSIEYLYWSEKHVLACTRLFNPRTIQSYSILSEVPFACSLWKFYSLWGHSYVLYRISIFKKRQQSQYWIGKKKKKKRKQESDRLVILLVYCLLVFWALLSYKNNVNNALYIQRSKYIIPILKYVRTCLNLWQTKIKILINLFWKMKKKKKRNFFL